MPGLKKMLADKVTLKELIAQGRAWCDSGASLYQCTAEGTVDQEHRLIDFRIADSGAQRVSASALINRMYSWRGYSSNHEVAAKPDGSTFTVWSDEKIIGTLTLTVDSEAGLSIDKTFAKELKPFRAHPGASLCELTKFAFDPSPNSRPLMASLFHIIYLYGIRCFDCTDLFIEVNPRHVRFYEIMLGFVRVGPLKTNSAVDAPSQLMRLRVSDIRCYIDIYAGCEQQTGRSLYPHFFELAEEKQVGDRIADILGIE
jgi:hypothetical protein